VDNGRVHGARKRSLARALVKYKLAIKFLRHELYAPSVNPARNMSLPYSCNCGPFPGGSAFQADSLGNQIAKKPGCAPPVLKETLGFTASSVCDSPCTPNQYEQSNIPTTMAVIPLPNTTVIRLVKSTTIKGVTASIGTALSSFTWGNVGVLVIGTESTYTFSSFTATGFAYLNVPRGILAVPEENCVIVVGTGYIVSVDQSTNSGPLPAVARVNLCTNDVFIQVGNGDTLINEEWNDVQLEACGGSYLVAGNGKVGTAGPVQAVIRKLDCSTLMPVALPATNLPYVLLPTTNFLATGQSFDVSNAVSIASSGKLNLIVAAVQATIAYSVPLSTSFSSSLLWAVNLDGTLMSPITVTSYNNPATGFLRTPASVSTLSIVSVQINDAGVTYATSCGTTSSGAPLPLYVTVVHAFNCDTDAILSFGTPVSSLTTACTVSGITTWYGSSGEAARPTGSTVRTYDGSLLVFGNLFSDVSPPDSTAYSTISVPNLPWLGLRVPQATGFMLGTTVTPFLIRVNCSGNVCSLLRPLACPCSSFIWAAYFVLLSPTGHGVMIGDCASKPLAPSQPATMLFLTLQLNGSHTAKLTNAVKSCLSASSLLTSSCDGVKIVDNVCTSTTLVVNGPVVVGSSATPATLPGAIKYEAGVFYGYTPAGWVAFSTT